MYGSVYVDMLTYVVIAASSVNIFAVICSALKDSFRHLMVNAVSRADRQLRFVIVCVCVCVCVCMCMCVCVWVCGWVGG